jgi:hypothetical protein
MSGQSQSGAFNLSSLQATQLVEFPEQVEHLKSQASIGIQVIRMHDAPWSTYPAAHWQFAIERNGSPLHVRQAFLKSQVPH